MAEPAEHIYSDRYKPVRLIARGGMAEVWLARDTLLDRMVALKVLFPELSVDQNFVERFRREAQAAANLSHPNIVSVYDWSAAGGTYFIAMEYVDGRPLSALLREEGPLPADRAAAIGSEVAAALGFAHRNGVIHRDVKPGNVLVTGDDHIKVTDFGIARAANTEDNLTQTGAVMGTATYFSPEQAQGLPVDQRSDVYALGVVLYEMVAGRPPFVADGPVAVAYKHVHEQAVPPSRLVPEIPAPFEAVVMQAMAKDLSTRYATAEELRADLLRFRQGRPVLAEPLPAAGAVGAAAAGAAAAGAALGLAGSATPEGALGAVAGPAPPVGIAGPAGVTGVLAPVDTGSPTQAATSAVPSQEPASGDGPGPPAGDIGEPEEPRRRATWIWVALLVVLLAALGVMLWLLNNQIDLFGKSTPSKPTPVTVPVTVPSDLVGKQYKDAVAEVQALGVPVKRVDVNDTQHPAETVVDTNPKAGQQVAPGDSLELDVSTGPPPITEPDVLGLDYRAAVTRLKAAGFAVAAPVGQDSDTAPPGQVLNQDPPAGTQGHNGDTVTLTVSNGKGNVLVPDETGKDQTQAANELNQAGLKFTYGPKQGSATVPAGNVISTNPPAGTSVPRGSLVTIIVSSGPAKIRVPYVVGLRGADARSEIENRGLVVAETAQPVSNSAQNGKVLTVNPAAGTTVDQGSTVTIVVGQYSPVTTTAPPASSTTTA